jgi:hypothetical protein
MGPLNWLTESIKYRVLKVKAVVLVVTTVDKMLEPAKCYTLQCKSKCITQNQLSFGLSHKKTLSLFIGSHLM